MPATLIIAARDEVIAPARSRALIDGLAQAGRVVQVVNISAGHNDIYNSPAAQAALRAAFR
jgi:predicted esterase